MLNWIRQLSWMTLYYVLVPWYSLCYSSLKCLSHHIGILWPYCSYPNGLVTSNMAPAYPHGTRLALYPAEFLSITFFQEYQQKKIANTLSLFLKWYRVCWYLAEGFKRGPVFTCDNRVLKGPLGRSLHWFAQTPHSAHSAALRSSTLTMFTG